MIKINKGNYTLPPVVSSRAVSKTTDNETAYINGVRSFTFDNTIYGHVDVKKLLIRIQKDKCCFCERKVSAGEPGHVEHYRPKGGYKINDVAPIVKPGYYWLAYTFNNLYFSCNRCNTSFKKNYFPLLNEVDRATNHNMSIVNEHPLIIDPAEDPSLYLIFVKEKIKPFSKSVRGKETIKRTGLNRRALSKERLEYLRVLDILALVARGNSPEASAAKAHFKKIAKKNALFSYMVVCNFPDLI